MKHKGFVLFVVMIFLLIMSMLGIAMFGGFISDQKNASNLREKQRAIEAAETAMDGMQYWVQRADFIYPGTWNVGVACSATTTQVGTTPVVCNTPLANPATLPWAPYSNTYQPSAMSVNAAGGANTYATTTNTYIEFMGTTSTNPSTALYRITTTAQGGNATAASVLQTVYQVKATVSDASGG